VLEREDQSLRPHLPLRFTAVLALTLLAATPVAAGGDGTVTFRLTLRGTPVPTDSFTLAVNADNGMAIDPGVLCGPGSDLYNDAHVACTARNYDCVVTAPVGTKLTYTYARYTDYLASGGASGAQILLEGSITVAATPHMVTLVYDYSLGSVAGTPVTLPNTSAATPDVPGLGLIAVALLGGLGLITWRRRAQTA